MKFSRCHRFKQNFPLHKMNKWENEIYSHLLLSVSCFFLYYRIYSINSSGSLINFWTLRVGAYSTCSRWALIRINTVVSLKKSQYLKFCDATAGFPAKLRQRNDCRNSILKTCHYQDQVLLLLIGHAARENASTNQERYLVLVSDTSSVWNFCSLSLEVISRAEKGAHFIYLPLYNGTPLTQ